MRLNRLFLALGLALASCGTPALASDSDHETASAINHAIDKATDGLGQIAHALSAAAPQAWALAVHGTYATGLANIIVGVGVLVVALIFEFLAWIVGGKIHAMPTKNQYDDKFGYWLSYALVVGICSLVLCGIIAATLISPSNWVRVISPDGYLAQQILSKAL